jgi:hypothetical protein
MKYLYCLSSFEETPFGSAVSRFKVMRETDATVWVNGRNGQDIKISKKTYRTGDGRYTTYYKEETEWLKDMYKDTQLYYRFKKAISVLSECKDMVIMEKIIGISKVKG